MSDKPKIKLTKTLPSEEGFYYYCLFGRLDSIEIVSIWRLVGSDVYLHDETPVDEIGGYWAKVDQSMFEIEG